MAETVIHNFDLKKLIAFAETAKGEMFLKTPEGDILNLKSRLTQLLALSSVIDASNISEASVICKNSEDETRLFRMNLYGKE
ncbi:MAG: hypothetical protein IJZ13_09565 [Clostridia bacterium]|nr:hypothetical protein [Clostridia bacterium]